MTQCHTSLELGGILTVQQLTGFSYQTTYILKIIKTVTIFEVDVFVLIDLINRNMFERYNANCIPLIVCVYWKGFIL